MKDRNQSGFYQSAAFLSRFFSLKRLIEKADIRYFLPFWHSVTDEKLPHLSYLYKPYSSGEFKQFLDSLLKHFKPVDLETFVLKSKEKNTNQSPIMHLSFDDGLKESATVIAPILKEKGIPATFFINPRFIDNNDFFYRYKISLILDKLSTDRSVKDFWPQLELAVGKKIKNWSELIKTLLSLGSNNIESINLMYRFTGADYYFSEDDIYMSLNDLNFLHKNGFGIGSHSLNHQSFDQLSLNAQLDQVQKSMEFIHLHFHQKIKAFSFPFSDNLVPDAFFKTVKSEKWLDCTFGTAGLKRDYEHNHFQRIPMEGLANNGLRILKTEYIAYALKKKMNRHFVQRK